MNHDQTPNHLMRAYAYVVISLALHAFSWLLILRADQLTSLLPEMLRTPHTKATTENQNIEVVLLEENPKAQNTSQGKASFLAQKTQRVQEETQARFRGDTRNLEFPNRPKSSRTQQQESKEVVADKSGEIDIQATERLNRALSSGISTLSESLPSNIKFGDFTSLNTDQYLYFSFFNRIAPRIRFNWQNGVEAVVEDLTLRNFQLGSRRTFSTEVEVRLDSKGYLEGVSVFRSSGIPGLDAAVVRAFELATPFINPPAEMVKADGLIRLYYGFNVHFEPQLFARPNGPTPSESQ